MQMIIDHHQYHCCSIYKIFVNIFTLRFAFLSYFQNHNPLINIETEIMIKVTPDCLQLLCKHSSSPKKYLRVTPGWSFWSITDNVDESRWCWIHSAAAGGMNPADPSSGKSDRWGWNGWRYSVGKGGWKEGDITVECVYKA